MLQAEKNVFVVFYSGERAKSKILKICEAFGANRYPFSEDLRKQAQMITEVCIIFLVNAPADRCGPCVWVNIHIYTFGDKPFTSLYCLFFLCAWLSWT